MSSLLNYQLPFSHKRTLETTERSCKCHSKQPVVCMSPWQPDFPMPLPLFVQPKRKKWKSWNIGIYGKRGSFRKRACLTEIPRIMEKWQKGKHGKGIVKQLATETCFSFFLYRSLVFTESCRGNKNPLMWILFPSEKIPQRRFTEDHAYNRFSDQIIGNRSTFSTHHMFFDIAYLRIFSCITNNLLIFSTAKIFWTNSLFVKQIW